MQELLVNKEDWNEMNAQQQSLLETDWKAVVADSLAEGEAKQFDVLANAKKNGVEIRYWSDEILSAYNTAWKEVVAEQSEKAAFFKDEWTDLNGFRKIYDLREKQAFQPRDASGADE